MAAILVCAAGAQCVADSAQDDPVLKNKLLVRGAEVYRSRCADCHGAEGQGVEGAYEKPLAGDSSIGELGRLIERTMPEGEPELCVGEDAKAAAAYIHYAFYSEAAQIRNRPPRISFVRLTGSQLRQSLSDLYGHFAGQPQWVEQRGLEAEYLEGSRYRRDKKKFDRIDPALSFDWGREGPGEGISPEEFFVRWKGGLLAPVPGTYEIIVRSSCAFVFDFGAADREFINNHVQSGNKTEFRKSVVLAAGRVYPILIDFYQRKRKTEQPPARISLSWIPPHQTEQVIPKRYLLPGSFPATFALQTNLPPDDRSYGFERGIAIDRQWDDSTTAAALEFAQAMSRELWPRYRRSHGGLKGDRREQLQGFLYEFVETAFRGRLDEATRKLYVDDQIAATEDDTEAIRRSTLITLKSPRFLYPQLDGKQTASQRAANRLALTLHDSLPADPWLQKLVFEQRLASESQIRSAARRMVRDYRTQWKTRELLYEWLNLNRLDEITKDPEHFPDFDSQLVSDLRASLDAFLDAVVWEDSGDYRDLVLADWSYTSERIEDYYGSSWNSADEPQTSELLRRTGPDQLHRAGVLTHPYLMSALAYQDSTSPVHRGVFLIRHLLGRTLRPPAEAFTPLSPKLHPDLTTRQRVSLQTSPEDCQVCHVRINGLGFTLENFDAVGRYRTQDRGQKVDAAGYYTTRDEERVEFTGHRDLARFLAQSDEAHRAFVNRAFQHFVKQPIAAYGSGTLDELTEQFRAKQFSIPDLLIEIAVVAASAPASAKE